MFPDSAKALHVLRQMQAGRVQMALVVHEHGGAAGIVTVQDVVEELVGEIYDETDPDHATVDREPDGTIVVPGRYPVHDLADLGIGLPTGNYATIAGLVLHELRHIPNVGSTTTIDQWTLEVRAVHDHTITQIALTATPSTAEQPDQ